VVDKLFGHVNSPQVDGFTPVHYACFVGDIQILELLVAIGGNMHALSKNGVNCLHLACQKNHLEMTRYLINRYNFSPEVGTKSTNKRAIHLAA
jgi:ankyrin repeat protein